MADRDLVGRRLGQFVLRGQIGKGGYGVVHRAAQPPLGRDVVVKVLYERRHGEVAKARFLREAQLASRLDHPYAAHVYDSGVEEDGLLWIAMELVDGVTLADWLKTRGPMPLDQFAPFFDCVAQVVHAAHECGIVHRDLKPSNIMVIERGGRLFPKLLDFGIAKMTPRGASMPDTGPDEPITESDEPLGPPGTDEAVTAEMQGRRLTRPGVAIGSRAYMALEQWSNACAVGPPADIYSLGVVAFQTLTGRLPFTAESTDEYYRQHREAVVPSLAGEFSPDLDRAIRRALAKSPEARHASALELAAELQAALRANPREQLRSLALQWQERARSPDLLSRGQVLADLERCARSAGKAALSELECSYLAESQRRARQAAWLRRSLVAVAAAAALAGIQYWTVLQARIGAERAALQARLAQEQARSAQAVMEATVTQAEVEQGRSALLHGEPEAQLHLGRAYQRGDHSPSTAFMFARALQPRLAEQARFKSSFGRMWSAAFSPDGRQIVTTDDRGAQLWDAQTGRLLVTLPHGDTVYQAVYGAGGATLVTAGGNGAVRIWNATSGALVRELTHKRPGGKPPRYGRVVESLDGKLVAAIDINGDVAHVWDAATGAPLAEIRNDGSEFPFVAFSADGRWLATTGGNDVRVVDTQTWRPALTIRGPRIHSLAFDPTGPRLVTGAATGDAAIWAIPSGARLRHLREIGEPVEAVAFSPDGQLVVAASRDGAEQVWRARSGELQSQFNPRHSKILAVEFDPSSKLVLAAGTDGTVVIADAALGMPIAVLEGPKGIVWAAHFDPSSRRVIGASWDGTARVWDASSPYRRWSSPPVSDDCGIVTSPEPDRRFIAVGCKGHPTRVWDTARDQLLAELPSASHVEGDFTSGFPVVSGSGDRAAIARGNAVEIYELPGGRLLRTIVHGAPVSAVAFAATGRDVVSGAVDGSLLVARESGALLALPNSTGGSDAVGFLPDGRVVAADARRRLRVHDPGGAVHVDLELPVRVMSLRIDGARLVAIPIYTGNPAPPLLLDLERYRVIAELRGHVGRVFSARWVAGSQILTAGADGTAQLWDGSTGQLRQIYRGSSRLLSDAALTPDGLVIAGGADGLLRFWDAASGRQLWVLQAHKSQIIGVHVEGGDIVTRGFSGELSRWTLPSPGQVIDACGKHAPCAIVEP